jgi:hypothetical protein
VSAKRRVRALLNRCSNNARRVYLNDYRTFDDAVEWLPQIIDEVYNTRRLHVSVFVYDLHY